MQIANLMGRFLDTIELTKPSRRICHTTNYHLQRFQAA